MAGKTGLTALAININNVVVGYVPNSLKYKDGDGEQSVKTQAAGGGQVETVYFDDVETKMGEVKFEIFPTEEAIAAAKEWKTNRNTNAILLTSSGNFTRSYQNMAMVNDPEFNVSADGTIEIEFKGDPAI